MMDIEVDHRDAFGTVGLPRVLRARDNIVEKTKSHGTAWLGVMTWWTDGAKRIVGLPGADGIDRRTERADAS